MKARPGNTHGYDIVDHNALCLEIGSEADYERFVDELHRHRMGLIADIEPNHMGIMGSDNVAEKLSLITNTCPTIGPYIERPAYSSMPRQKNSSQPFITVLLAGTSILKNSSTRLKNWS
ncbi:alpha-amylase family glycosyl hydrolase [Methylobacter sp. BlB1]|uniref:alpha-amylase family glycosyl hydrolase n=1 Tax=Methylobacter sp. BlB1 TaxID=2785914 RepID=UPI001892DDA1|nr:hypothetical protein [Methylobacter sp. BlB1]